MKVLRNREVEVKKIRIGDQIIIPLVEFENLQPHRKSQNKGTLFLFDDCVTKQPMNKNGLIKAVLKNRPSEMD